MTGISKSVGLKGANKKEDVITIKQSLNNNLKKININKPLIVDGISGPNTVNNIKIFQKKIVKLAFPDGRVDPNGKTISTLGIEKDKKTKNKNYQYTTGPQELLAKIAKPYIGATEAKGNRMGSDPRMKEIFEADWIRDKDKGTTDGYAWCCAFVSMCVQKLIARSSFYSNVKPPRTAGVSDFRKRWASQQNCLIFTPNDQNYSPHKGDIVVYTFSHIGIVSSVTQGSIQAIEGNTNSKGSREGTTCMKKIRPLSQIRCFIRLPIPMTYDTANKMCLNKET